MRSSPLSAEEDSKPMDLVLRPASEYCLDELVPLFNRCFIGYPVRIHVDRVRLAEKVRTDGEDMEASGSWWRNRKRQDWPFWHGGAGRRAS